uniref:hypothetical protein n=1 Tax=Nonomuraea sp. CA-252377 TaxID=3240003 RepID=UPI003F49AC08
MRVEALPGVEHVQGGEDAPAQAPVELDGRAAGAAAGPSWHVLVVGGEAGLPALGGDSDMRCSRA